MEDQDQDGRQHFAMVVVVSAIDADRAHDDVGAALPAAQVFANDTFAVYGSDAVEVPAGDYSTWMHEPTGIGRGNPIARLELFAD